MEYEAHVYMCRSMVAITTTTTTAAVVIVVFVTYDKELSYYIRSWTGDDYVGDKSDAFRSRWI